ncbi:hypothetical protein [Paenibacillus tengchongensis]|uniref:hypothetical protein n=1 Tax=Paenibacillus tengchongensis TaxID=2608684 RepID=UPI00124F6E3D|nr:hypothetical protein [Paenibacillus tengchongensis]
MNLYIIRTLLGEEAAGEFLEENYVSPGIPGPGDLQQMPLENIRRMLEAEGRYSTEEMEEVLEILHTFVHLMQDGDYILIADKEWVYLGDLGDYFYAEHLKDDGGLRCHRRGVTWLRSLPRAGVNPQIAALLQSEGRIVRYEGQLPAAKAELWLAAGKAEPEGQQAPKVDAGTIAAALEVLKEALHSGDPERRERAAAAILHYAK